MPLWQIYHPEGTFTSATEKESLAASITKIYTNGPSRLPAFYVIVNFIPVPATSTYIGGVDALIRSSSSTSPTSSPSTSSSPNSNSTSASAPGSEAPEKRPFIRITIDQIAVRLASTDEAYATMTARIDGALKGEIADKGYDWEYHVVETERRLWKINGIAPPALGSHGEDVWRRENWAVPLERTDGRVRR